MESDEGSVISEAPSVSLEKKVSFHEDDTNRSLTSSSSSIAKEDIPIPKRSASDCLPAHESLKAWDDARRAREANGL